MKAVYTAGRFQPPTIGHAKLIQTVKSQGGDAFVFVSSSKPSGKEAAKNPLTSVEKVKYLKLMFPSGVTFVDTATCDPACGGPLAAYEYLKGKGYTDITLVAGSDRAAVFGEGAPIWASVENPPKFIGLNRDAADEVSQMSGTKARALAKAGDLPGFTAAVMIGKMTPASAKELYDLLRTRLKGGRKTRRRKTRRRKTNRWL
jgi:cytidyltransferase-like protein